MRIFLIIVSLWFMVPAQAAEPYRVTPYFECLVGKGVTAKVWDGLSADKAMDTALKACESADPGKPPVDQDVVDNREYMRVVAYGVIEHAESFETLDIGMGN